MQDKRKRAFTITQLVITIAVVTVLVIVFVPMLSSMSDGKASTGGALDRMNLYLEAEEELHGKPQTMSEVVELMEGHGYTLERLAGSDGKTIAWNEEANRFLYLDDEDGEDRNDLWLITDEVPEITEDKGEGFYYSYYLAPGFTGTSVHVRSGVDVGEHADIDVLYDSAAAEQVTIRTNGGTLTVDALNASVDHYGMADDVHVQRVAKEGAYSLYGQVRGRVTLVEGRAVLAGGASADTLLLLPIGANAATVAVEMNEAASLSVLAARVQSVSDGASVDVSASVEKVLVAD